MRTVNSVNSPTSLSTSIVPPCCCVTMSQLIDRPSPVPSPVGFVVTNGWNNLSLISGAMPVPLSRTRTSTASPNSRVVTLSVGRKSGPAPSRCRLVAAYKPLPKRLRNTRVISCGASSMGARPRSNSRSRVMLKRASWGAGAMIGEVQRLLDQAVEVDRAALARDPARVFEHALDDAVGALAVLGDLVEVAAQHLDDLVDRRALVVGERCHGRRCRLF